MKVIDVARSLGVTPETVRFYTRIKVLNPTKSKANGYWEYGEKNEHRLRFVLSARQLGFTVEDIWEILERTDEKNTPCPTVRCLIDQRLQ